MNQDPQSRPAPDLGDYRLNWIRDLVLEYYLESKTDHEQRYCEDVLHYYRHWKNWVQPRLSPDDYKSNIGVGIAYPIVEIVFSHLQEPWLSGDEIVRAVAEAPQWEPQAVPVGQWVNRKITQASHAYQNFAQVKRAALIGGRGILKPHVQYRRPRTMLQRIIQKGMNGLRLGSYPDWVDVPHEKALGFRSVDPFDWWRTPGTRIGDEDWTFERYYLTTSQVHAKQESGEWNQLAIEIGDEDALGFDEFRARRLSLEGYPDQYVRSGATQERKLHRVIEFQGRLQVKDSEAEGYHYEDLKVILLNENWIAYDKPLKSHDASPEYIVWEPNQDPMSDRPIGLIEPMEDQLLEMNDLENIALDNARKVLESPLAIDPNAWKSDMLRLGPAEINWVRNPKQNIVPIEMKDLPPSFYQLMGGLSDLVQRITGVSDYFGGMNTGDSQRLSKTATGMQLMANLAATRFGPLIASLDRDFYRKVADWTLKTGRLWLEASETFRTGADPANPFATVGPRDLEAELQFRFKTRALDPKTEERRQNLVRMTEQLMAMDPMIRSGGYYTDYYELAKRMLEEFGQGDDVEKIVKIMPPEMMMQMGGQPMGALGPTAGPIDPMAMDPSMQMQGPPPEGQQGPPQ